MGDYDFSGLIGVLIEFEEDNLDKFFFYCFIIEILYKMFIFFLVDKFELNCFGLIDNEFIGIRKWF